jgi:ssDNA-specific exonuclease RecJ
MRRKTNQKRLQSFGILGIRGEINEDAAKHILQKGKAAEPKNLKVKLREQILMRAEKAMVEHEILRKMYLTAWPEEREHFARLYGFEPQKEWIEEAAELDKKRRKRN